MKKILKNPLVFISSAVIFMSQSANLFIPVSAEDKLPLITKVQDFALNNISTIPATAENETNRQTYTAASFELEQTAAPVITTDNSVRLSRSGTVEISGSGTVYYTTDGREPTTSSAVYSGGIDVISLNIPVTADTLTVKAIAAESGKAASPAVTKEFTLTSTDASLSGIKINGTELEGFSSGEVSFEYRIPHEQWYNDQWKTYDIEALPSDTGSAVSYSINDFHLVSDNPHIDSVIIATITVASESGSAYSMTYTLKFIVSACPHEAFQTVTVEPSCGSDGYIRTCCPDCGYDKEYEYLPATGHSWRDWSTADGMNYSRLCPVCGTIETSAVTGSDGECVEHDFSGEREVIAAPTCTSAGSEKIYCANGCDGYLIQSVPKAPHSPSAPAITASASCETDGEQVIRCADCGQRLSVTIIPATGHSWGQWVVTVPATVSSTGVETRTCSGCGETETRAIPKLQPPPPPKPPVNPGTPGGSSSPTSAPAVSDNYGNKGWGEIAESLDGALNGDVITINLNGAKSVPASVFRAIRHKDVTIIIDVSDSIKWVINGLNITSPKEINFGISNNANSITTDMFDTLIGKKAVMEFTLGHNGDLGFTGTLLMNLGKQYAGYYANLFYYNPKTKVLEFISAPVVGNEGYAEFLISHASEYAIVISENNYGEVIDVSSGSARAAEIDMIVFESSSPIMIPMIITAASALTVWVFIKRKKAGK